MTQKTHDGAKAVMSSYFKALDKAAKANTVKDNFAANKKSKAAKYLNKSEEAKLNKTEETKPVSRQKKLKLVRQ